MPLIKLKLGPFSAVYVGDYGTSSVLTRITSINTAPIVVSDEIPEQYEPAIDNSIQTGLRKITTDISFYGDDNILINLARRYGSRTN